MNTDDYRKGTKAQRDEGTKCKAATTGRGGEEVDH